MPKRILIADNDREDADLVHRALANLHAEFEYAETLEDARARAKSFDPALVLLDVGIPHYPSGPDASFDEILNFIREFKSKAAVVILTGHVDSDNLDSAMSTGACAYIDKERINHWAEFEARIREAYALHTALTQKEANAALLAGQALLADRQQLIKKMLTHLVLKVGDVQDKKDDLLKKQIREQVTKERDAYWKRIIVGGITTAAIAGWDIFKFCLDKLFAKH